MRTMITRPGGERSLDVCGGRMRGVGGGGGVNGRFIYHRCHSPPGAEERPPKLKYSGVYSPD